MKLSYKDKKSIILSEKLSDPITFIDTKKKKFIEKQVNELLGEEFDYKSLFLFVEKIKRKYFFDKLIVNTENDIRKLNDNLKLLLGEILEHLKLDIKFDGLYSVENFPGYTGLTNIINNGLTSIELNDEKRTLSQKNSYFVSLNKIYVPIFKTSLHKIMEGWISFDVSNSNINHSKLFTILNIVFANLSNELSAVFYINNGKLLKNAIIDPLTNTYKKEYFRDMLKSDLLSLEKDEKNLILFLDIDHFKQINDTYGHDVGDFVLREFGNEIKNSIRDIDYIGRYGGEEFIVSMRLDILCDKNCQKCHNYNTIISRIRKKLNINISNNHILNKYDIRFSGGVASSGELHLDNISEKNIGQIVDKLIKIADERLYKAKENGRDRIYLTDGSFID